MEKPKKLTRVELIAVVRHLQGVLGGIAVANNDRNPNRAAHITQWIEHGEEICREARAGDDPNTGKNTAWGRRRFPVLTP